MTCLITLPCVTEDSTWRLMAILKYNGVPALQANVTTITYSLRNPTSEAEISSGSLTVATVIYDTEQHAPYWTRGERGYNFRWDVPNTLLTSDLTEYRLELTFTLSGEPSFATQTDHGDGTATLMLTPGFDDAGSYAGVTATVSDNVDSDSETFTITVTVEETMHLFLPLVLKSH